MAIGSSIEWTEATWNPVAGCSLISSGCTNCYAMRMAARLEKMGQPKYGGLTSRSGGRSKWNGNVNLDWDGIDTPRRWKKGSLIFVNSMSDLFHEEVPDEFIQAVFKTMSETPQHTYQLLTKRGERLEAIDENLIWPTNVWMGVSVENEANLDRMSFLKKTKARTKFLSLEPLLGPLSYLDLKEIDWVIAGGESGPGARPIDKEWVREIRDTCLRSSVPFHFKQWGGVNKKKLGRILDGRTWDQRPKSSAQAFFWKL